MSVSNTNPVNVSRPKRVAIVIANPTTSTTTGWPVGFWWSELTHPYLAFVEAGYTVDVYSPEGGSCIADNMSDPNDASGYSKTDLITQGFLHTPELAKLISNTKSVDEIKVSEYDALMVGGGQAPMFNFETAYNLHQKFLEFYTAHKVVAALCHGVAILKYIKDADGQFLAKGKTVTGFANCEEDFADEAVWSYGLLPKDKHIMPWRIEDAMKSLGANYVHAGLWKSFAVRDGQLITGQQNFSGGDTAKLIIEAVGR